MNIYESIKKNLTEKADSSYRGDDYWDLSDWYVNGDIDKEELKERLLELYKKRDAQDAYKEITGERWEKSEVPSGIKEISDEEADAYINAWNNGEDQPFEGDRFICCDADGSCVAIDDRTGDCWTEEFSNKKDAIAWLNDEFEMDDYLEGLDESAKIKRKRRKRPKKTRVVIKPRKKRKRRRKLREAEGSSEYTDEEAVEICKAYDNGDNSKRGEASDIIAKYAMDDNYPKLRKYLKKQMGEKSKKKDLKYGVKGSPEDYIKTVADEMGVNLDDKVPFEMFYAPDSDYIDEDNEENNEYWYDSNYDYATFYDKILHDMGYGENPILGACRAEVHEVSDGKYQMTLSYNGEEHIIDIKAGDGLEQVKDNVDSIIEILGRKAVKEAESGKVPFSHTTTIYYGTDDEGNTDSSEIDFVVDNRDDFPEISDEDIHDAFKNDNLSIFTNDLDGSEWMFDIKSPDGSFWLMYKGRDDDYKYHFYIDKNGDEGDDEDGTEDLLDNGKLSMGEAEEEFKPNGVVDDIKKRGDGKTEVTSPMELNTGVLPIVNVDCYSRQDYIWDEGSYNEDGEYGYYEYYENGEGKNFIKLDEPTQKDVDEAIMRYAPSVIEEYLDSVLPGSKVKATGMYHPQYYNYSGDELEFEVIFDESKFADLEDKAVADPEFVEYLKNYRSYSGFVSYMADDLDEYYSQDGWKKFVQVVMFSLRNQENEMKNSEENMWNDIVIDVT